MVYTRRVATASFIMALALAVLASVTGSDHLKAAPPTPEMKTKTPKKKKTDKKQDDMEMPALNFKMKDIDGKEQDLKQYHGNVILMVNTASQCGFTPQYEGLQKLYKKYGDQGFVVLAFPANNFGRQEPGTNPEIKQFCTSRFAVTFPIFGKVSVKGDDACDLYKYLTNKKVGHEYGGSIKWNFSKFLINRQGEVVERFSFKTSPEHKKVIAAIEKEMAKPIPDDSPLAEKMKQEESKKKQKDG
ncbi:MAG: glutathione peroxidase [Phycisphaerales bacterium]|nr:glutathione peroxidase [Phycisphaerales bacterium]